jgi:putative ATP-dependent endonuclease of OLD family
MAVTLTFSDLSEQQRAHFYEIIEFDLSDLSKSQAIVRFQASWPKGKRQAEIRRTGGPVTVEQPEVPTRLLASLPVTFLPALRDAETCLAPGPRSRLAVLLEELADRRGGSIRDDIKGIYKKANDELEAQPLISELRNSLQVTTQGVAGTDYVPSAVRATPVEFGRILRTLRVQMDGTPIESLDANGLGYNNLLYIAIVLEHLKSPEVDECPLLLLEEPEAHLHPQLMSCSRTRRRSSCGARASLRRACRIRRSESFNE